MLTVLDLFSGIGGFALGLESTGGFRTVAFCEIEPFPRAVLRKHWPDVPIHEDVCELRGETVGPVDVICGGFPCQDISVAGKGAGLHGSRSGLWFEAARLVGELRPRWCLFENVGALRTRGIDRVCSDLEAEGYAVWPLVVGAWAVGAPHRRERVWIVAHRDAALREQPGRRNGAGGSGASVARGDGAVGQADRHGDGQHRQRGGGLLDGERAAFGDDADGRCEWPVGKSTGSGLEGQWADTGEPQEPESRDAGELDDSTGTGRQADRLPALKSRPRSFDGRSCPRWPARPGEPQHEWEEPRLVGNGTGPRRECWPTVGSERDEEGIALPSKGRRERCPQQPLGGAAHGLPERLARRANRESLKALGNSVVPQVVAAIGRAILKAEEWL